MGRAGSAMGVEAASRLERAHGPLMGLLPVDLSGRAPDGLAAFDPSWEAAEGRASATDLSAANILGIDAASAVRDFAAYARSFCWDEAPIARKAAHSLRVAAGCVTVAGACGEAAGLAGDLGVALLAGLWHDAGRPVQHAMFRDFGDARTGCDHGDLGAAMLGEMGLADRVVRRAAAGRAADGMTGHPTDDATRDATDGTARRAAWLLAEATRWHSKLCLPDDLDDDAAALAQVVRDADIADILALWLTGHMGGRPEPIEWGDLSPSVAAAVAAGETVDRADLRTAGDEVVSKAVLPWAMSEAARGRIGWIRA